MSNASRFISAYNKLDSSMRRRFDIRSNATFTEAVRLAASKNSIIRKYEDDLMDYGRLRNAIVHKSNSDIIIAEPHLSVVTTLEKILQLVTKPPKALDTVAKPAVAISYDTILKDAITLMTRSNFSNVPVVKGGEILGVLNNKLIVEALSKRIDDAENFLNTATASSILKFGEHYLIASKGVTIDVLLQNFTTNHKLTIVILTDTGGTYGDILGVITTGDIIKMQNMLD